MNTTLNNVPKPSSLRKRGSRKTSEILDSRLRGNDGAGLDPRFRKDDKIRAISELSHEN